MACRLSPSDSAAGVTEPYLFSAREISLRLAMSSLSLRSRYALLTCARSLQSLAEHASERVGLSVTCGHRGKEAQDMLPTPFPRSPHNAYPSKAFNWRPFPNAAEADWEVVREAMEASAKALGMAVTVRRGHAELNGRGVP